MTEQNERKWTPGPWEVRYHRGETQLVMGDGGVHMCDATYYPWVPENHADWHLIAAAPDLYEVLEEFEAWEGELLTDSYWGGLPKMTQERLDRLIEIRDMMNAALSKARGVA